MKLDFQPTSIQEQLLFTTVRIDTQDKEGKSWSGTGFIVSYKKDDMEIPFLVTNKHVIKDMVSGKLEFWHKNDGKLDFSQRVEMPLHNFESLWHPHPNSDVDIAVMPIGFLLSTAKAENREIFYKSVPNDMIASETQIQELDAIEEITTMGFPKSLRDEHNLMPIVRKGITSTHPALNFDNLPMFLIDAPIFEGASGSPVFIINIGMWQNKTGGTNVGGNRILLLGVVAMAYSFFTDRELKKGEVKNEIEDGSKMVSVEKTYMNLGVVFKSTSLIEALDNSYSIMAKNDENK